MRWDLDRNAIQRVRARIFAVQQKKTEKNQLKVLLCEKVQGAKYRKYNKKKYINDFTSSQFHRKYMNEFVRLGWQTEK